MTHPIMVYDRRSPKGAQRLIGVTNVTQHEQVVLRGVLYRVVVMKDGAVVGDIRAPKMQRLTPFVGSGPDDFLQLKLEDGRNVFFRLRAAQHGRGGWGEIEGLILPTVRRE